MTLTTRLTHRDRKVTPITQMMLSVLWSCVYFTTTHNIYRKCTHFNHFGGYSSVTLSTFTLLYSHHCHPSPEIFHLPKQKLLGPLNRNSVPLCLQPLPVTIILASVSVNLTTLGTSFKWNHTTFVLLCLVYIARCNVFKVHTCCSTCQNFLSFNV